MGKAHAPLKERFFRYVEKTDTCWLWTGCKNRRGYGKINAGDHRNVLAHRVSYEITNGPIPSGATICHRCDVPACVNPDHLFAASQYENMQDMVRKGRSHSQTGELCGKAKLKEPQVLEILASSENHGVLAARYGISKRTIHAIKNGTRWAHISG